MIRRVSYALVQSWTCENVADRDQLLDWIKDNFPKKVIVRFWPELIDGATGYRVEAYLSFQEQPYEVRFFKQEGEKHAQKEENPG